MREQEEGKKQNGFQTQNNSPKEDEDKNYSLKARRHLARGKAQSLESGRKAEGKANSLESGCEAVGEVKSLEAGLEDGGEG